MNEQALPQIARTDPHRVKALNEPQHLLHLLRLHLDAKRKEDVIGNGIDITPQIPRIINVANDVFGNDALFLVLYVFHAELLQQILMKSLLHPYRRCLRVFLILPIIRIIAITHGIFFDISLDKFVIDIKALLYIIDLLVSSLRFMPFL